MIVSEFKNHSIYTGCFAPICRVGNETLASSFGICGTYSSNDRLGNESADIARPQPDKLLVEFLCEPRYILINTFAFTQSSVDIASGYSANFRQHRFEQNSSG